MIFKKAVTATPDIRMCFQKGLKALGGNSRKISLADNSKCEGSLDIDNCTRTLYPQSNRWDYCFCYRNEIYFVEVHTANTTEVSTVIRKLQWLKDWLNHQAPELNKLKASSRHPFYWIQSSKFNIPATSKQFRTVVQAGIKPIPALKLP
ncbi:MULTISPECIES: hypothetical protein [Olivibacter]|uniref:Uncharacterized protein n=1 Tax=Olivibacter oleidegradans TaxID=760123 RepID=A0ABV6HIF7_9SPHI|nr:hypothetical protein [Olivibacter jilunii]